MAIGSFVIASSLILFAIAAPFISPYTPYDPATLNLMNGFSAPLAPNAFTGDVFIFGSDDQGRDILSTILFGMRISLFVGFSAVFLAMILGVALGLVAAMAGGVIDAIIMRVADIQLSFPIHPYCNANLWNCKGDYTTRNAERSGNLGVNPVDWII